MPIYTRQGDDGTASLCGGVRADKDHPQIEVCGNIDELSASLGVVRAEGLPAELEPLVLRIQHELIVFCTEIVSDNKLISPEHIHRLEEEIDRIELELPPLKQFIIAGENRISSALHVARTICRRAERSLTALFRVKEKSPYLLCYLNRLSDLLFLMARKAGTRELEK
jgi:cob(I)alamin adenosyltransferase